MSADVGGNGEGAVAAVVAAKLRGTRIIEGWVGFVNGSGLYYWKAENKPVLTVQGKCDCGGKVRVLTSHQGAASSLSADWIAPLKLEPGVLERIIIVVPED